MRKPNGVFSVNRDQNACKNILYIVKYFLDNQLRPKKFSPKPKEKKVIINTEETKIEKRSCCLSKVVD